MADMKLKKKTLQMLTLGIKAKVLLFLSVLWICSTEPALAIFLSCFLIFSETEGCYVIQQLEHTDLFFSVVHAEFFSNFPHANCSV